MEQSVKPAISNVALGRFLREVVAELKKVTWPTREETVKLTVVVIVISILVGAFIGGLDSLFLRATTLLFKR
ncbi:MAG: preprotein translocase subunit SecE [Candidatus Gottesmanbacteria bacterium]|nr:preprotein translocase subunit SecE [Candidatus Gottesmanbacteria bacterium]